ncbi:AAA family ATPase [Tunturibacter empetritectus]|uniref:Magnesium chelatase subunit D n=1 Tax=Tunturiibacter lichenicola TaxID=2051959 RepID=A0A7W8J7G3_9BACT|nr:AAA family ATPase [Edaphobacter lichenicola]MBB5343886.1 magnesium chelatase subunit D [Edaphobacter lichenicola]
MTRPAYPFAAIVGQEQMKMALLLAAVDWRLGVLLRGDKGAGKTTTARALAELLPKPGRFVNLPIGITEDRLLGGMDLGSTLKGEPALRPGLVAEANGGVLYIDEVNLLPDHLADALLDAAATGVSTVEREGFSAVQEARFVLMGSMNPEEGSLRPQLLDRFALVADITASGLAIERREVVERRLMYDADPSLFAARWLEQQIYLQQRIAAARVMLRSVQCSTVMLEHISTIVCERGVLSLRADLAIARASCAQAALLGCEAVTEEHIEAVLPFALAHRIPHSPQKPPLPQTSPSLVPQTPAQSRESEETDEMNEQRFSSLSVRTPELHWTGNGGRSGAMGGRKGTAPGPVVRSRKNESPTELDSRSSVLEAVARTGRPSPRLEDLYEKVREPLVGTRFLFVVDSSGSHAARERMRVVKGAVAGLIERSLRRRDEVAVIVFRGESAEILVDPTSDVAAVLAALEYLPTGGRTPLAHALELANGLVTPETLLLLVTDGRANVPYCSNDAWYDALQAAAKIQCPGLVVDTESSNHAFGKAKELADAMRVECISLSEFEAGYDFAVLLKSSVDR